MLLFLETMNQPQCTVVRSLRSFGLCSVAVPISISISVYFKFIRNIIVSIQFPFIFSTALRPTVAFIWSDVSGDVQ